MFLDQFHRVEDGRVRITAEQASRFAKQMAGDYNPIHDPDARRFCVPGDLLFSLLLAKFGLSQCMTIRFCGMVGNDVPLIFEALDAPDESGVSLLVRDEAGKVYLTVERSGDTTHDEEVVANFTRQYIAFSGRNFPHFLQPLMLEKGVMFNPARPLVIYDSMGFCFERLDIADLHLDFVGSSLEVNGKRGDTLLEFSIHDGEQCIGSGSKKLVVSGLRDYCAETMDAFVESFEALKREAEA
ncbi:DUF3581 family protein [Cobetia amphilecti]|uniref:DUF3581 family protein n=1 Tax=Cobetia amphilecti TaxID=1055104 RepID=UPI002448D707|nr:DUF3581 family protein [Cobetia litoralis]MDH2419985.1 DUF3581 family protein [Cobetia litoralis]MDH2422618.1 DUF3581 family protein [Cobetia litoralis]